MRADAPPVLDYAAREFRPWPIWVCLIMMLVWPLIACQIWAMAFLCPILTVGGIVNLFHPFIPPSWNHGHTPTTKQTWLWIAKFAGLSVVYILLARWHLRWRKRPAPHE